MKDKIDFDGKRVTYKKGDAYIISRGIAEKHKAIINDGDFVKLLLIENI